MVQYIFKLADFWIEPFGAFTLGRALRKSANSRDRNRDGFIPLLVCDKNLISSWIWFSVIT